MSKKKRVIFKTIGLVIGSWAFANYAYWASHQPQYSWIFDVNATVFGFVWLMGLITIFASLAMEVDDV